MPAAAGFRDPASTLDRRDIYPTAPVSLGSIIGDGGGLGKQYRACGTAYPRGDAPKLPDSPKQEGRTLGRAEGMCVLGWCCAI